MSTPLAPARPAPARPAPAHPAPGRLAPGHLATGDRCTPTALRRSEVLPGTASHVRDWLLLEQPGPWGRTALTESRLDPALGAALRTRARAAGVRPILIRPAGRGSVRVEGVHAFVVRTGPGAPGMTRLVLDRVADVLDLDLRRLVVDAGPPAEPVHLVCTNGKHDACCAIWGRPVALALSGNGAPYADRVWECSHIGGDRFAGNVVCMPHGLYYGHQSAETAGAVVDAYEKGEVTLDGYRGRSCYPFPAQAAEAFLRRSTGLFGVDELSLVAVRERPGGRRVVFTGPGSTSYDVDVSVGVDPDARMLTCGARPEHPATYTCTWAA